MATPYVGELRLFAGSFAPLGWALCQGQQLAIADNETLFQLLGTTYGGDGQNTFALPDLRGRVPVHQGSGPGLSNRVIGQSGGTERVMLTAAQMPTHTHAAMASKAAAQAAAGPSGNVLAASSVNLYGNGPPTTAMGAGAVAPAGDGQAHDNMAPFQAIHYIIALVGVFPSQS